MTLLCTVLLARFSADGLSIQPISFMHGAHTRFPPTKLCLSEVHDSSHEYRNTFGAKEQINSSTPKASHEMTTIVFRIKGLLS